MLGASGASPHGLQMQKGRGKGRRRDADPKTRNLENQQRKLSVSLGDLKACWRTLEALFALARKPYNINRLCNTYSGLVGARGLVTEGIGLQTCSRGLQRCSSGFFEESQSGHVQGIAGLQRSKAIFHRPHVNFAAPAWAGGGAGLGKGSLEVFEGLVDENGGNKGVYDRINVPPSQTNNK